MVHYEVTVEIRPDLAAAFEAYMRERHLPEIWDTGCFAAIRFARATETRWRTAYAARTRADLDRYLAEHTARLREDFLAHFPEGASVSREVWEDAQAWG